MRSGARCANGKGGRTALLVSALSIGAVSTALGDVTSCQFSWDADPGPEGAGRPLMPTETIRHACSAEMPAPRDYRTSELALDIPLTDPDGRPLTSGPHTLYLRSCDADGCGPWYSRRYYIPRPDDWHIVGGEWFVDATRDPARAPEAPPPGMGTPLDLDDILRCEDFTGDLPWTELEISPDLPPGSYAIGFRLQDSEGAWGPPRWEALVIPESSPVTSVSLTAASPVPDACCPRFVCPEPTIPDVELQPDPAVPGSYFAEVDLGHFGVGEIGRIPLWIRAESATGASLAPVPPSVPPPPRFVRGDGNSDGAINLTDGIALLSHLFQGTDVPECRDAADADDNGALQLTDAIVIFQFLFLGEDPPREPSPPRGRPYEAGDCGSDPTDDPLECAVPAATCTSCPGP